MSAARTTDGELRLRAPVVFAVWTLYALITYSQWAIVRPAEMPAPWKWYGPWILWLGAAWTWAALTPGIAWLARRARPRLAPAPILAHLAALAVIHLILGVVGGVGYYFITTVRPTSLLAEYQRGMAQTLLLYTATLLAVLALDHARLARQRAAHTTRLEADLARARLDTLRRQLQPHFLFNTLNTIAALIDTEPRRASEMVARLGELLRHSLEEHERQLIPLGAELEFVRLYTAIESVRFESWLQVTEEVEHSTLDAWVPPMILQPLVENAIKHGIAPSGRKGTIVIRAARANHNRLLLQVIDDGAGLHANGGTTHEGIGLRATRERLRHLFVDDARLQLERVQHHTRATIDLPFVRDVAAVLHTGANSDNLVTGARG